MMEVGVGNCENLAFEVKNLFFGIVFDGFGCLLICYFLPKTAQIVHRRIMRAETFRISPQYFLMLIIINTTIYCIYNIFILTLQHNNFDYGYRIKKESEFSTLH